MIRARSAAMQHGHAYLSRLFSLHLGPLTSLQMLADAGSRLPGGAITERYFIYPNSAPVGTYR